MDKYTALCQMYLAIFNFVLITIFNHLRTAPQWKLHWNFSDFIGHKYIVSYNRSMLDISKLEDAKDAGTKNGVDCTLIVTEGDSGKAFAVAGLGVIGQDKYGVFPLGGKFLNVREKTEIEVFKNRTIKNLIKILGLQKLEKYEKQKDLQSLRYGRLMIMTDQDEDGSHIKGLLINFIHNFWPELIRLRFIEEFITPFAKAEKDNVSKSFYSLPELDKWKKENDCHTWEIKYCKGLDTNTTQEIKEYFNDMDRHRVSFKYSGSEDDDSIILAFSKKKADERKKWLTNGMENGLPELYLDRELTKSVSYRNFIDKELILYGKMKNELSIPSLVDGLRIRQRKVLFTFFKRDEGEVKVAELAGSVAELSAYHIRELKKSLTETIIKLAQNFVGSNNLNLLLPIGQFGTRSQGGEDCASARYISTELSPLARHIFIKDDDHLLNYLNEDNKQIEPEWYIPIIPMILVNGAFGIGYGWSTEIPKYDVREIIASLKGLIKKGEPIPMSPSFKNFRGRIAKGENQNYVIYGMVSILSDTSIEITELPIGMWTQTYKESVLEEMVCGNNSWITGYEEHHTDTTVRFVISLSKEKLDEAKKEGLHKVFELSCSISTSNMVLFDKNGELKKYDDVLHILREFYDLRLDYYGKRKCVGLIKAELLRLSNQVRFSQEVIKRNVFFEETTAAIISRLITLKFDSDPVKKWRNESAEAESNHNDGETEEKTELEKPDYDYLMNMSFLEVSQYGQNKMLNEIKMKKDELNILQKKMWLADLDAFEKALNDFEKEEVKNKIAQHGDTLPSANGILIEPIIENDT